MLARSSAVTPERLSSLSVALSAAITSTLLCGWAPLSIFGRAFVFSGSFASGLFFARWSMRSSSPASAFAKSVVSGAAQANVAASGLVVLAMSADAILGLSPSQNYFGDVLAFMFVMLFLGSAAGSVIGVVYGFVPAYVVASRDERSHATLDRVLVANGAWLAFVAAAHLTLLQLTHGRSATKYDALLSAASWAGPLALAAIFFAVAFVRANLRASFLARVRAGREPRYRIVPLDTLDAEGLLPVLPVDNRVPRNSCRSALVRIAVDHDAEPSYRTNAIRRYAEPIALLG